MCIFWGSPWCSPDSNRSELLPCLTTKTTLKNKKASPRRLSAKPVEPKLVKSEGLAICRSLGEEDRLESEGATSECTEGPVTAAEKSRGKREIRQRHCSSSLSWARGKTPREAVLSPGGQGAGGRDWSQLSWLPVPSQCPLGLLPRGTTRWQPPPQSDAPSPTTCNPLAAPAATPGPPSLGSTLAPAS